MSTETKNQEIANEMRRMAMAIHLTYSAKHEILKYAQSMEDGAIKRLPA